MLKRFLTAAAIVAALGSGAYAELIPLPNGSFEDNGSIPSPGFTQAISDWVVIFDPDGASPSNIGQHSGIFTSYGNYVATDESHFVGINNLGAGTVQLQSSSLIFLAQRGLQFDWMYVTQDLPGSGSNDNFFVIVEIFDDALGTNQLASLQFNPRDRSDVGDQFNTTIGSDPFAGQDVFADADNNEFFGAYLDLEDWFNSYARVTFIVDNAGPAAGGANGLGVSGILLDNIVLAPEPGTLALFGLGALGLCGFAVRRRRKNAVVTE